MIQNLPTSPEAEKGLLSAFLRHPVEIGAKASARGLSAQTMTTPSARDILETLQMMWSEQKPIDCITLSQEMRRAGTLAEIGGISALMELGDYLPTLQLADSHIEEIMSTHSRREVMRLCSDYISRAGEDECDAVELLGAMSSDVTRLSCSSQRAATRTMHDLLKTKLHRIEDEEPAGNIIQTGLDKLDEDSPLLMGDMPIICGETKAGKSILALNIATHIATTGGRPVVYFSLEDASEKPLDRVLASISRVPSNRHHRRHMSDGEHQSLYRAIQTVGASKLSIRDDVYDLGGFVATCRQFKAKYPNMGAVVLDYAQLLRAAVRKNDNREQEIALISRTCRLLGLELGCAMIILSQLNKDGDTRESKALENDMTAQWRVAMTDDPNKRTLSIPRQRNGSSGIGFPLTFLGHIAKFENYSGAEDPEEEQPKPKKRRF